MPERPHIGRGTSLGWLLLAWLCLLPGLLTAQEPAPRSFSGQTLEEIREQRRFDYGREPLPPELNPKQIRQGFDSLAKGLRYGLYAIAFLLVGGIAFFLLRESLQGNRRLSSDAENLPEVTEASLVTLDFLQLARQAEAGGDFSEAIRYHFLQVLQLLQQRALIDWRPAKTNDALAQELPAGPLRQAFLALVYRYEYVCYGQRRLDAGGFEQVRRPFLAFPQQLNAARL